MLSYSNFHYLSWISHAENVMLSTVELAFGSISINAYDPGLLPGTGLAEVKKSKLLSNNIWKTIVPMVLGQLSLIGLQDFCFSWILSRINSIYNQFVELEVGKVVNLGCCYYNVIDWSIVLEFVLINLVNLEVFYQVTLTRARRSNDQHQE